MNQDVAGYGLSGLTEEETVEREALSVLHRLQEIYCKNELYSKLEFIMGKAEEEENYYEDVESLIHLYLEKVSEFKDQQASNQLATSSSAMNTEEMKEKQKAYVVHALNNEINGKSDDANEEQNDEEDAIPLESIEQLYTVLDGALDTDNLEAGIAFGALKVAEIERENAEQKAREAVQLQEGEKLTSSVAQRKAVSKVSPEEMFRMAQHVRSGMMDESELFQLRQEDVDAAEVPIELNENQPLFLKRMGVQSVRRKINYRRQLPSEMLRNAQTTQHRQAVQERLQREKDGDVKAFNSMELIAQRQLKINADRRIIHSRQQQEERQRQLQMQQYGGEDDRLQTEAAAEARELESGLLHTELDEKPEERGFRKKDLPSQLPPWMRHSVGSKPAFGLPQHQKYSNDIQRQRRSLPIYAKREELLQYVDTHNVTILVGETGSGKTTQIPQYLLEHGYGKKGVICCTQPRRVAAETLAARVAEEYGCSLGEEVGYTVRFNDMTSSLTKIKYMTDGMLLREALLDDSFQRYSVIILDEAHERSINTDLLFAIVRQALQKHSTLKVLVTSATLETVKFCTYFGVDSPFLIEGRTFPVETYYLAEPTSDYVRAALQTVMKIHLEEPPGDVLVFFTGQEEIEMGGEHLFNWLQSLRKDLDIPLPDLLILPLTATMPQDVQSKVFEETPPGCRKVVLATNVAETSITIDNLYYVIDSGFCKQNIFDPVKGMEQLKIVPVSQAQAKQRSGRAGRIGPGKCFRIYTEEQFLNDMPTETVPDIMRTNLFHVTLQLKAMNIDLLQVELMDAPSQEAVVAALEKLRYLEALDDDGLLTPLGGRMAQLSIDPSQSKTLLTAVDMGCANPILTIVSMLAVQKRGIFYRPRDQQEEADAARRQFIQPEGDHITLMCVYDSWVANGMSEEWSKRQFLKHRMLVEARDTREQLLNMLTRNGQKTLSDENDNNLTQVRKAITAGYFFNVAKRVDSYMRSYVTLSDRREVYIHPSSSLLDEPPQYVLYDDIRLTKKEYMWELLVIEPQWLLELAPAYYSTPGNGRRLTRAQEAERLNPILRSWESGSSWRISRVKRQRK